MNAFGKVENNNCVSWTLWDREKCGGRWCRESDLISRCRFIYVKSSSKMVLLVLRLYNLLLRWS